MFVLAGKDVFSFDLIWCVSVGWVRRGVGFLFVKKGRGSGGRGWEGVVGRRERGVCDWV